MDMTKKERAQEMLSQAWLRARTAIERYRAQALQSEADRQALEVMAFTGGVRLFGELPLVIATGLTQGVMDLALALGMDAKGENAAKEVAALYPGLPERLDAFLAAAGEVQANIKADLDTAAILNAETMAALRIDLNLGEDTPAILKGAEGLAFWNKGLHDMDVVQALQAGYGENIIRFPAAKNDAR